jgi:hypothetical protein
MTEEQERILRTTTTREYIFTQKELRAKLGFLGDIKTFELYSGLSRNDEEKGVSQDRSKYVLVTIEKTEKKEKKVAKND